MTTRHYLPIALLTLFPLAASAGPPATVPTPHASTEHVSAAWVDDSGRALVVIKGTDHSRLIAQSSAGNPSESELPGFAANRLTVLASPFGEKPGRLFLGGSGGDEYFYRLLVESGDGWKTAWDSREIPGAGSEDLVEVSDDGRFWALVRGVDPETVEVLLGELPATVPAWRAEIRSQVLAGDEPSGPTADFPTLAILGTNGGSLPDVAVAWRDSVRVLGGGEPKVKAVLELAHPPSNLIYQPSADVLWVGWGGGFDGFPLSAISPAAGAEPQRLAADRRVTAEEAGFVPSRLFPLQGGGVAVTGGTAGRGEIAISATGRDFSRPSEISGRYASFEISSSGDWVLALPRGTRSQEVVIHR